MWRRFLFEIISMPLVEGKERPEISEREVLRMEMEPELSGPGKERARRAGRVEKERESDTDVRVGTERVWRAGRASRSRACKCERRGKSRVVRAGRYRILKNQLVRSSEGKEIIASFEVGGGSST